MSAPPPKSGPHPSSNPATGTFYIKVDHIYGINTRKIEEFVPGCLKVSECVGKSLVPEFESRSWQFLQVTLIYVISSIFGSNMQKFHKTGPSGLYGCVGVVPIDSEGASVVRLLVLAGFG